MDKLLGHTNITGGKRMRPALVLFSALACGEIGGQHHQLAAALEMIHTASLIHDDVLDHAVQRRHVETVNSQWDNKTSVLLGDYLFTHAFHLASQIDSLAAIRRLAVASNRVCG
ncbi:MAG: polyprenyl synthetase family protein, partial [Planctomycetaceae bacterium]|nr:polyprenyl synthetase family protein [Planctomycetaceae bacterium]